MTTPSSVPPKAGPPEITAEIQRLADEFCATRGRVSYGNDDDLTALRSLIAAVQREKGPAFDSVVKTITAWRDTAKADREANRQTTEEMVRGVPDEFAVPRAGYAGRLKALDQVLDLLHALTAVQSAATPSETNAESET